MSSFFFSHFERYHSPDRLHALELKQSLSNSSHAYKNVLSLENPDIISDKRDIYAEELDSLAKPTEGELARYRESSGPGATILSNNYRRNKTLEGYEYGYEVDTNYPREIHSHTSTTTTNSNSSSIVPHTRGTSHHPRSPSSTASSPAIRKKQKIYSSPRGSSML